MYPWTQFVLINKKQMWPQLKYTLLYEQVKNKIYNNTKYK